MIKCPYCQTVEHQVKIGHNASGSQRYLCKGCRRKYTPAPSAGGYSEAVRQAALKLYIDGMNFRRIARTLLNPVIWGWVHYHKHTSSSRTFAKVDHAIVQTLWGWAKRRHPNKGAKWVKAKYFKPMGNRHWIFQGEYENKTWNLVQTSGTHFKKHIKIKGEANPFDPQWETYFEHRLAVKMADNLQGRRQLLRLWKEQYGLCPVCQQKITKITGWNNHHILQRTLGGPDTNENRVLLHPNCHQQIHSKHIPVEKPCPVK